MKIQNNKTKTGTTVIATLMIGLILLSSTTVLPNISAEQNNRGQNGYTQFTSPFHLQAPTLASDEKQKIIDTAMNLKAIKAWSDQWQFATMNFKGEKNSSGINWNEAVVVLHLPPNSSAPVKCDIGWVAGVRIDISTDKVIGAWYPTLESHQCHDITLDHSHDKKHDPPGYSTATQNDVNSTTSYYGNSAVLQTPSYSSSIFSDMNQLVAQILNARWNVSCYSDSECFTQVGWLITVPSISSGGISSNSADIVYVDESTTGNKVPINTNLGWQNGGTEDVSLTCGSSGDVAISITYGTSTYYANTHISCSTTQYNDVLNNSIFFENHNTSSYTSWPSDITGTVDATSAEEYNSGGTGSNWSTSHNVDLDCSGTVTQSSVITGDLTSGNTATWQYLSNEPYAC
ncbi:MAG TPA: hypothetical protein VFJ23_03095 [Candidatus Nitrosotalea sp.]|nr:hypothetical protein [Candidatus Nitrosotalea sp.]